MDNEYEIKINDNTEKLEITFHINKDQIIKKKRMILMKIKIPRKK